MALGAAVAFSLAAFGQITLRGGDGLFLLIEGVGGLILFVGGLGMLRESRQ
jgi:hypothetical protein